MACEFRSHTVTYAVHEREHLPDDLDPDTVAKAFREHLAAAADAFHLEHPDWFGCEPDVL